MNKITPTDGSSRHLRMNSQNELNGPMENGSPHVTEKKISRGPPRQIFTQLIPNQLWQPLIRMSGIHPFISQTKNVKCGMPSRILLWTLPAIWILRVISRPVGASIFPSTFPPLPPPAASTGCWLPVCLSFPRRSVLNPTCRLSKLMGTMYLCNSPFRACAGSCLIRLRLSLQFQGRLRLIIYLRLLELTIIRAGGDFCFLSCLVPTANERHVS